MMRECDGEEGRKGGIERWRASERGSRRGGRAITASVALTHSELCSSAVERGRKTTHSRRWEESTKCHFVMHFSIGRLSGPSIPHWNLVLDVSTTSFKLNQTLSAGNFLLFNPNDRRRLSTVVFYVLATHSL